VNEPQWEQLSLWTGVSFLLDTSVLRPAFHIAVRWDVTLGIAEVAGELFMQRRTPLPSLRELASPPPGVQSMLRIPLAVNARRLSSMLELNGLFMNSHTEIPAD